MSKVYGVMLIGCGYIGLDHLAQIHYRDNVDLIAVVDTDLNSAKTAARRFGAKAYGTDYTAYLHRDDIDIVIIATYVSSHLSLPRLLWVKQPKLSLPWAPLQKRTLRWAAVSWFLMMRKSQRRLCNNG